MGLAASTVVAVGSESEVNTPARKKEEGIKMKNNISILLCLGMFLILPNLASADCADLGGFNAFLSVRGNTVVLYAGSTPPGNLMS